MTSHGDWLFVQIPLTGSTSLTEVIGYGGWNGHAYKHYTAQEHRERLGAETYNKLRVFTIVRNPFDRLVSLCAFIRKPTHVLEPEEFQLWVSTAWVSNPPLPGSVPWLYNDLPQRKLVDAPMVDYVNLPLTVYRFEGWQDVVLGMDDGTIVNLVESITGTRMSLPFPRRNWTRRFGDYRLYYNDKTVERVSELYADDLQRFGYAFE